MCWSLLVLVTSPAGIIAETDSESKKIAALRQQAEASLAKGVRWLQRQQRTDGSWRSQTYPGLESGTGSTALVFATLVELRSSSQELLQECHAAKRFLISQMNGQGMLDRPANGSVYPVYATALFLRGLAEQDKDANRELIVSLSAGLRAQQCDSRAEAPFQGGWGPGVLLPAERSEHSPANVSVTLFALDALARAGTLSAAERDAALVFLARCQRGSEFHPLGGGFCFTPQEDHPLNKAGWIAGAQGDTLAKPYRSATCDGVAGLLACGVEPAAPRIRAALKVLSQLPAPRLLQRPLDPGEPYSSLDALYFYTAAANARLWRQLQRRGESNPGLQQQTLLDLQTLLSSQHSDGSWSNPLGWMREDDPLVATPLALQTIQRALAMGETRLTED